MGKLRKTLLIFAIILIQSTLAVAAGLAAIAFNEGDALPPGVYAGNAAIGGMGRQEASKAIEDYYKPVLSKESLKLMISGKEYSISYADFDLRIDGASTVKLIEDWRSATFVPALIKAYFNFNQDRINIKPVIKYNEGKLRQKLIEFSGQINEAPVNASISMEGNRVVKKAETSGYELDIAATASEIGRHLTESFGAPFIVEGRSNSLVKTVAADIKLKDYSEIEQILSQYFTKITDIEVEDSIRLAAAAINGTILEASGKPGSEFSFVNTLRNADKSFQNDNEGYDQVASTLYAALLAAGIEKDAITRLPHTLEVEYIKPGLDAWISGNGGDLKFRNTFPHKIALFANVEDNMLIVGIAGSLTSKAAAYEISTEIVQEFEPPAVYIENNDLKPGEKVLLSPGKAGMLVRVKRNGEVISEDRYEPQKAIYHVGPGTKLNIK